MPLAGDDMLGGFELGELLDGRERPGHADPEADGRWLRGRKHVLHLADARYDPRQVLALSGAALEQWREARLLWLQRTLEG